MVKYLNTEYDKLKRTQRSPDITRLSQTRTSRFGSSERFEVKALGGLRFEVKDLGGLRFEGKDLGGLRFEVKALGGLRFKVKDLGGLRLKIWVV